MIHSEGMNSGRWKIYVLLFFLNSGKLKPYFKCYWYECHSRLAIKQSHKKLLYHKSLDRGWYRSDSSLCKPQLISFEQYGLWTCLSQTERRWFFYLSTGLLKLVSLFGFCRIHLFLKLSRNLSQENRWNSADFAHTRTILPPYRFLCIPFSFQA